MSQLIEVEWRTYASVNYIIIGSDNAIIRTNAGLSFIGP